MMRAAVVVCVVLFVVSTVAAQVGGLSVVVIDGDGLPLPGATVTISHETGSVKTTAQLTDQDGTAAFPVLRPGSGYAIMVSFPGLTSIRYDDLKVKIAETQSLTVTMMAEFTEQVKVRAERDVIDLDKTETSTKFGSDFIADLPVPGRFYQKVLTLAPGVQDADGDGNPNVHGSRSRDFQAIVSGVSNVDPLTGQWFSRVNANSIEEMEVITAGAGVEFGRAQGGFAVIVQKQGTNSHEGIFEFYWQTSKLDGDVAENVVTTPDPDYDTYQPMIQLSGPIVKDRLWYRVSYERRDGEEPIDIISGIEIHRKETENRDALLTWQASPRNKLAFQYRSDPIDEEQFGVSSRIPQESSEDRYRDVETYSLTWTAPYSPRVLVQSTVAWQDVNTGKRPAFLDVENDCVPGSGLPFLRKAQCLNLETDLISGSFNRVEDDHRQRFTLKSQATIYAGRFWGMNHQFKFGLNIENERYFRALEQGADITYYEVTPFSGDGFGVALTRLAVPETDDTRATGTNWGVYAEDQIKPAQNLTITLGARVDREEMNSEGREIFDPSAELRAWEAHMASLPDIELYDLWFEQWPDFFTGYENVAGFRSQLQGILCENIPADSIGNCYEDVAASILDQTLLDLRNKRRAEDINIENTNVSPFLSVAWSPGSSGKTALKASAGRHYNNVPLIVPLQELEPVLTDVEYRVALSTNLTQIEGGIRPTLNTKTVDHDLRTPYQDEFSFSIERELWPETSVSLTYIDRNYKDQIQDVNVNVANADYGYCRRTSLIAPYPVVASPGGGVGSGRWLLDPYTGEVYEDTDPGIGDGRLDDCAGLTDYREEGVPVPDPFGNFTVPLPRPDGKLDLYVQNPYWGDILHVGNSNEIDYEAWVLELVRRQYRSWQMNASYTYSRAEGNGEDFFQELGDDPSLRSNVQGYQSYDQRHVVKLNATTITPWGIRLGTAVSWQSGLPYSILTERTSLDILPPWTYPLTASGNHLRQTYTTGVRNDQRNDSYWNVDVRVDRSLRVAKAVDLQLSAEIFNLLDDDTYMIYNPFYEAGQQVNGVNEARRRIGRRWQVGMRMAF